MDHGEDSRLFEQPFKFFAQEREELILWAKQHAWLSTTDEKNGRTRWSQVANEFTALPLISKEMQTIASALLEVGPITSGEMGKNKISWHELESWYNITESDFSAWELSCLMAASSHYISCIHEYDEKTVNSPYDRILTDEERLIEESAGNAKEKEYYESLCREDEV